MKKYQSSNTKKLYEIDFVGKRNKCPECTDDRRKKSAKDMQYFKDTDTAYCFHCNTNYFVFNPYEKAKEYVKPKYKNITNLTDKLVKFFESRGISQTTLNEMKIYSDFEYMPQFSKEIETICFPFFMGDELINIKFRGANKSFKLVSNAELIFYNYNALLNNKEVIICEGEIDALSWYNSGFKNVVSVPNGANKNLEYLDNCISVFDEIECVYLSCDNDTKGIELRDELIRRIGIEKCKIIDFKGCKDANDFLQKYGLQEMKTAYETAKPKKYEGVVEIDSMYSDLRNYFEQGEKQGLKIGVDDIDIYITWETSRLAVVTGIPSSGKSEFVDYILTKLNLVHGWKSVYFTPENYPLKYHYEKLHEKIIGKRFTKDISTDFEFDMGFDYIKDNFFYILPEEETTLAYVLERTKYLIKTKGIKCLVIDPYNKLEHDIQAGGSETNYISKFLDKLTHFCKLYDILIILIAHPRKIQKHEVPTLYDINGSANFYNKCDYGFTVHRTRGTDGAMNNEVEVHWQKIKFKNLGKQGITEFVYNYNNGRFEPKTPQGINGWDNSNWLTKGIEPIQLQPIEPKNTFTPYKEVWDDEPDF